MTTPSWWSGRPSPMSPSWPATTWWAGLRIGNLAFDEGLRAKLRLLVAELAEGPAPPSAARKLVIEAISYAWLELWTITCTHPEDQVRRGGAHRRLMQSLRTLAQITAAERPRPRPMHATQVNVTLESPIEREQRTA